MKARLFLSHSSRDADLAQELHARFVDAGYDVFLDEDRHDGIRPGEEWEAALWRQLGRADAVVVLFTSDWAASPWCVAEAVVARRQGKIVTTLMTTASSHDDTPGIDDVHTDGGAPDDGGTDDGEVGPATPPAWLLDRQFGDLDTAGMKAAVRGLADFLDGQLGNRFPAPDNPYPGLASHTAEYAGVFFGRDREIGEVRELLEQRLTNHAPGLLLVLGASGAGKSSLMRAGVLPRLGDDGTWVVPRPFDAVEGVTTLAERLTSAAGRAAEAQDVEDTFATADLDEGARLVRQLCRRAVDAAGVRGHVVLGVDQLEVVLRESASESGRRMLAIVLRAANDPATPLTVLATLRSDSFDQFQSALWELAGSDPSEPDVPQDAAATLYRGVPLDPMERRYLGEVIARPASRVGVTFEPGLVERLIADTGGRDALPLLATTLQRLFAKGHDDGVLELHEYESVFGDSSLPGGVRGVAASITAKAEQVLADRGFDAQRSAEDWRSLRATFLRLLELNDAGEPVARAEAMASLPEVAGPVLSRMVDERLMVTARRPVERPGTTHAVGEAATEVTVSVAHEALLRRWHRLEQWVEESKEALVVLQQLRQAADEWEAQGRDQAWEWPETRVVEAIRIVGPFVVSGSLSVTDRERRFVGPVTQDEILERLALGTSDRPGQDELVLLDRAHLGHRLDLLGDERPGVGLDDDGVPSIEWLPVDVVPAGDRHHVTRSRPEDSERARDALSRLQGGSVPDPGSDVPDEVVQPDPAVAVGPFEIAKYPVTWEQFLAFETARNYAYRGWWDGEPPSARPQRAKSMPRNHPATHMTWYAARAFTRWLTAETSDGATIRLPTEAEWELAATGGLDREYPWGDLEDPAAVDGLANTFDSRLSTLSFMSATTTTVGVFPRGASPVGALDMSGNCWEWCEDLYDPDEEPEGDLPRNRVVRGGSWVIGSALCTTRYSGRLRPHLDRYFVGFRPVRLRTGVEDESADAPGGSR